VQGLIVRSHRVVVRVLVISESVSLVCLQETKLDVISDIDVMELLGQGFGYAYLPADHSHGGIPVTWHRDCWAVSSLSLHELLVSVRLLQFGFSEEWWLTLVYGPPSDEDKPAFLAKLHTLVVLQDVP
jgi:hypothetical protein